MTDETEKPLPKLQRRHKVFCDHFLTGINAAEAWKKAKPDAPPESARQQAYKALQRPEVKAYLAKRREDLADAVGIRAEEIAREYKLIGFANLKRLYNEDGTLIPIHLLPDDVAAMLAGIDIETLFDGSGEDRKAVGNILKFKIWGKKEALDSLAKLLGFMKDKVEHSGVIETPKLVLELTNAPEAAPQADPGIPVESD